MSAHPVRPRRIARLAIAGTVATLAAIALQPAQPAAADPGFCGVRVGLESGVDMNMIYTLRNQCHLTWNFRVFIPAVGRYASPGCRPVSGGTYGSYTDFYADGNWRIEVC
ncbi:hypothetical protein [Fodinicola feengrottensis]|nr:hypothetical protein [Fodinicola feengrottensis]